MSKIILISGISSGLGLALAETYLNRGERVFGFSRRACPLKHENLSDYQCDLKDTANLPGALFELLDDNRDIDLVVLNAGVLGSICSMADASLEEMKETMDINMWANKIILDWLFKHCKRVSQVVAISSGAAVNGNRGWNGYSLSKAALNMLVKLYAADFPQTHFCSFAPGLVDTRMQDYLCAHEGEADFPSISKLKANRGTENMPAPAELAERLPEIFAKLPQLDNGCFIDIRKM